MSSAEVKSGLLREALLVAVRCEHTAVLPSLAEPHRAQPSTFPGCLGWPRVLAAEPAAPRADVNRALERKQSQRDNNAE